MSQEPKRRGRKPKAKLDVYFAEPEVIMPTPPPPQAPAAEAKVRRAKAKDPIEDLVLVNIKLPKAVASELDRIAAAEIRSRAAQIAKMLQTSIKSYNE